MCFKKNIQTLSQHRNDHNSTPKARFSIFWLFESSRRDLLLYSLRSRIVNVKKYKNTFQFFVFCLGVFLSQIQKKGKRKLRRKRSSGCRFLRNLEARWARARSSGLRPATSKNEKTSGFLGFFYSRTTGWPPPTP